MSSVRTELQREVVEALVANKAIDFHGIGTVLAKYAARAALSGEPFGVIIGPRVMDICIPVTFHTLPRGLDMAATLGSEQQG